MVIIIRMVLRITPSSRHPPKKVPIMLHSGTRNAITIRLTMPNSLPTRASRPIFGLLNCSQAGGRGLDVAVSTKAVCRPGSGHKLVVARFGPEIDELGKHVGDVGLRIDAVQFADLEERSKASPSSLHPQACVLLRARPTTIFGRSFCAAQQQRQPAELRADRPFNN
jgi:hypothetical protein